MKNILLIICVLFSFVAASQPNYTRINSRYNYLGFAADAFNLPGVSTPALKTAQMPRAGAMVYDSTGSNRGVFYYDAVRGGWIRMYDTSMTITSVPEPPTSTYSPVRFDTLERKVLINGAVTGRDEAFPSVERLPNGNIAVGWASTIAHATLGRNVYMTSGNDGLNWSAPTILESTTADNYRNLIFSSPKGDTTPIHYWMEATNTIYLRHSVNSLSSISARSAITSAVTLASEGKIVQFLGYNVMPVYSFAPDVPKAGIAYKNVLTGGTWTFTWFDVAHDGLQLSEGELIVEGDTLFYFLRSDANPTIMYRAYTVNLTALSTPATATPTEWLAGAPRVIRLQDSRYFINYRTSDGSAPDEGAYAVSNDRGRTWTKVGEQLARLWAYGSTIPIGNDLYLNVYSGQLSLDGTIYQEVFSFPGSDFINSGKGIERFGEIYAWGKHIRAKEDSISAGRDIGYPGRFNVVATGSGQNEGLNLWNFSDFGNTSLVHLSNAFRGYTAASAAPTTREQRFAFFEPTATGTDVIIDIGDATTPFFRMYQDGTIKSPKPYLNYGTGLLRIENTGNTAPTGSAGVGHEFFIAGGAAYWNPLNRTTVANAPGEIVTSALGITGTVTIKSALNLNPGVPLQLNGSAGTAGQILTSAGAGALPTWGSGSSGVTTMQAIGSTPNANGATISGSDLTLQPYSASFGGITTTGAQTAAGDKTWSGEAKFTSQFIATGAGLFRFESNGSGVPAGSTGVGFEGFVAGGTTYLSSVSRPAATYAPLVFFGSTLGFNGVATFATTLNLGAGVPLQLNGSAGTAGQVLTSAGAGVLPTWTSQSALGIPLSSLLAATGTNTINNGNNQQEWQWNSLGQTTGALVLSANTTAADDGQTLLRVKLEGTNATAGAETRGAYITNTHAGTGAINRGMDVSVSGGDVGTGLNIDVLGTTTATGIVINATSAGTTRIGLDVTASGGTNNYAFVSSAGNVGIGITAPTSQLHTTGTVTFANYGAGTATFDASGNVTSVSDSRLKYIQGNYRAGLKEIKNINPITYKWRPESNMETNHTYAGFSAQNIKSALGSEATGINKEGYLSVQDRAIMAAMINAIKELSAKVDYLEAELKKKK